MIQEKNILDQKQIYQERNIKLGLNEFHYADLYSAEGLQRLFFLFKEEIKNSNTALSHKYENYLNKGLSDYTLEAELLIELSSYLSAFIAKLFKIEKELLELNESYLAKRETFRFKELVVKREITKLERKEVPFPKKIDYTSFYASYHKACYQYLKTQELHLLTDEDKLARAALVLFDIGIIFKKYQKKPGELPKDVENDANEFLNIFKKEIQSKEDKINVTLNEKLSKLNLDEQIKEILENLYQYIYSIYAEQLKWHKEDRWSIFILPKRLDFNHLVETQEGQYGGYYGPEKSLRRRDGFKLTDARMNRQSVLSEIDYCLYCFDKKKDSCSKGFTQKDSDVYKKSPLGINLTGCPLNQKISESHSAAYHGNPLGALSIILIDNPMCPGTGHRICNECMRGCIYQKQDPVNIPQIETRLLSEIVYHIPYGVEIYGLLTRWNPINRKRPYAKRYHGKNVLVVGQGPAGYTLAHYLINEGFGVVGIDGLKIEPLPKWMTGEDVGLPTPIRNYSDYHEGTEKRILMGFGGVSEYGITVRWDKNFLNLIYMNLMRRKHYKIYGGIRFGGHLKIEDAWNLGFDHIAMSTGAGKPTIVPMKNNLINGIRKASDFLMTLQLTGAAKEDSLASLQIRLPAVVIGGGLTGVDTTTEIFAYYPTLVEKIYYRHCKLVESGLSVKLDNTLNVYEKDILEEYLMHGEEIVKERKRAKSNNEKPNFIPLIRKWGGVMLIYRKSIQDSPAYKLNYEEVEKALEEGIEIIDKMSPIEAIEDDLGYIKSLTFEKQEINQEGKWKGTGEKINIPARSVCVAAGTSPNTIYEKEYPGTFKKDKWDYYFLTHSAKENTSKLELQEGQGFFSSYNKNGKLISFYGDNHPDFAGNVVKAMASAKNGYPHIVNLFQKEIAEAENEKPEKIEPIWQNLVQKLDAGFLAEVVKVKRLTDTIIEIFIKSPFAAQKFQPGQFYRVQRYESTAPIVEKTRLSTESLALTGAWVDKEKGILSTVVLEMGHSSRLCANLKPGEKIICMGPTGEPTEIPDKKETILLIGGGLGNAVLFSIAEACRKKGNKIIYFAGYKNAKDLFKIEELTKSTDALVLCADHGKLPAPTRKTDKIFYGNIVEGMLAYAKGDLGDTAISLQEVNRLIVIGSDRMMAAVKEARFNQLNHIIPKDHIAIGSINSPMQCMMKEICAQCLQKHVDLKTGKEEFVFSCLNQDQHLDKVDFKNLNQRLSANSTLEKINNIWLDYCLTKTNEITLV